MDVHRLKSVTHLGEWQNSAAINEKMSDGNDKPISINSLTPASNTPNLPQTGSLVEVSSCSEQISTEDKEFSSTDISEKVLPKKRKDIPVGTTLHETPRSRVSRAASFYGPRSVETDQPEPVCPLLPSSVEACSVHEESQKFTPISRSQLKTSANNTEPGSDDLCAAILLACLFCNPLDCLLATVRGCNGCFWSLCSSLCSCEPITMPPLLNITHHCDLCGFLGVRCCLCDSTICDICLQTTECLDLAMEISQMLFH